MGRAAGLYLPPVLPHRHLGPRRRGDRNARRPGRKARRRAGVPADRGALDPRRPRPRVRRPPRGPDLVHGAPARAVPRRGDGVHPAPGVVLEYMSRDRTSADAASGGLDATLLYIADRNLVDRSRADLTDGSAIHALSRPEGRGAPLLRKDRELPDQPLRRRPPRVVESTRGWCSSLYDAFARAKAALAAEQDQLLDGFFAVASSMTACARRWRAIR